MTDQSAQTTVEIDLGGTLYVLQPKLSAMKAVNRMGGGYLGVFKALRDYDVDAFAAVIAAETGSTGKAADEIERKVYEQGVESLLKPLVRFVNICAAGGRDPDAKKPKPGFELAGAD